MTTRRSLYLVSVISVVLAIAYGNGSAVQGEPQGPTSAKQASVDLEGKVVVMEITGGSSMNSEAESLILERVLKLPD